MSTQTSPAAATPIAAPVSVPAGATRWAIDASHSLAHFSVRHMMVSNVRGQFSGLAGEIVIAPNLEQSQVKTTIDATTIETRDAKRDAHLKSADFFDVEKFPTITFVSKAVEQVKREGKDGASFKLRGELTLHGITKEVVLDVSLPEGEQKDPWGNTKRGAQATTKLNRKDYGLMWNVALETGGMLVGENINVELELELSKVA